jgi:MoxR-like ATPase
VGVNGVGKTTIARELERRLVEHGCHTMLLDGDQLKRRLFQYLFHLLSDPFGEVAVRRNIDLFHFVVSDEETAYLPDFLPYERLSAG